MPARRLQAMLYAIAATTAQRIEHPGTAPRAPTPTSSWSARSSPSAPTTPGWYQPSPWRTPARPRVDERLCGFISDEADGRPRETVPLLAEEEATLLKTGCRWRYAQPPGKKHLAGYHMGHYKLLAWQHVEYATIQLLDADLLPVNNLDPLFSLTKAFDTEVVACPGKVAPLNAGWVFIRPSLSTYEGLLKTLDIMNEPTETRPTAML